MIKSHVELRPFLLWLQEGSFLLDYSEEILFNEKQTIDRVKLNLIFNHKYKIALK